MFVIQTQGATVTLAEGDDDMRSGLVFIEVVLSAFAISSVHAQWVQANVGCGGPVSCFAASGGNLFAGTYSSTDTNGVYLSTNNGASWVPVGKGLANHYINSLVITDGNLLAGTYGGGTFLSTNNGSSWANSGLRGWSVTCFSQLPSTLFAGTDYGGVVSSSNNGASWSYPANNGLTIPVVCLAVSGTDLFAGGAGLFLSTNAAGSWKALSPNFPDSKVQSLAVIGTAIFAGTPDSGVYRSTDNGSTWTHVNNGLPNASIVSLAVSGTNIFAGMLGGVFLSTNSGESWREVNTGLPFVATGINRLGTIGASLFAASIADGVWRRPISEMLTAVKDNPHDIPNRFELMQNYPNPFNPSTIITYQLPTSCMVSIRVFDILGREVETLVNDRQNPGVHSVNFSSTNLPSGVYLYQLQAGTYHDAKTMLLLK